MTTPGSAAWWTTRLAADRSRRPRADGLTLEAILDGAIRLADEQGLDALTMRSLARALGHAHTSLYRHVESRDELLVLMVDRVLGELAAGDLPSGDPRHCAEVLLGRYRQVLLAHPSLAPALLSGQLLGPNALAGREVGLRLLLDAGASPELAAEAYLTLTHFVIGSAVLDAGGAARTAAERTSMASLFRSLPPDRYPTVVALADTLNRPDPDQEFAFGLRALLDGIAARITAAPPVGA